MTAFLAGFCGIDGWANRLSPKYGLCDQQIARQAMTRFPKTRIDMAKPTKVRGSAKNGGAFSARGVLRRARDLRNVSTESVVASPAASSKKATANRGLVWREGDGDELRAFDESTRGGNVSGSENLAMRLESCPALVLNADYQPLSYLPLSLWPWTEVMKALCLDRVRVVETYDHIKVRSASAEFPVPSVVVMKEYAKISKKRPAFSRYNVFLRDQFSCQYCGQSHRPVDLTFDHVVPKSRGGKLCWENVVTACISCNNRKGSMLLKDLRGMRLQRTPKVPSLYELQQCARRFPPKYLHESWVDYLYWDQEMEESDRASSDEEDGKNDGNEIQALHLDQPGA
ncbi:hypothetical protein FVE85_0391 [Porphyridium purpureum]|uniref:HNH nuclease domain-containing protein n=1 Tax=Porphyridium purpureum TaxID=35688 RepID=A0A5J4Z0M3_PORPP|nr:hypothetical protein FVE85_0391 [Porphyridium purpureum]|eukprot:POR7045..scf208_2